MEPIVLDAPADLATETCGLVESISTRALSASRFVTLCAPDGPGGKHTSSIGPISSSPSGVRTTTRPSRINSHSSSGYS